MKSLLFLSLLLLFESVYADVYLCEQAEGLLTNKLTGSLVTMVPGGHVKYQTADYDSPNVTKLFFPKAKIQLPKNHQKLLRLWKELKSGGSQISYAHLSERVLSGNLEIDVKLIVPEQVSKVTGQFPIVSGSNCFNSALNWFGLTSKFEYSEPEEIMKYLGSRFEKIGKSEPKQFGDLMIFRNTNFEGIIHVSIFVNDKYVWHKRSPSIEDPWGVHSLRDALLDYLRKPYCGNHIVEFYRINSR